MGDYLTGGTGLADCDGHGTAVAGILAASAVGRDDGGVEGMAPAAEVLAIRQSSPSFAVPGPDGTPRTAGDVRTLAEAIVLAVRSGATVINISEAVCLRARQAASQGAQVQAALRLAAGSDVVVVAAAGNAGVGSCATAGRGARRPGCAPRLVRRGRPDGRRGRARRRARRVHGAGPVGGRGRAGQRPALPRRRRRRHRQRSRRHELRRAVGGRAGRAGAGTLPRADGRAGRRPHPGHGSAPRGRTLRAAGGSGRDRPAGGAHRGACRVDARRLAGSHRPAGRHHGASGPVAVRRAPSPPGAAAAAVTACCAAAVNRLRRRFP